MTGITTEVIFCNHVHSVEWLEAEPDLLFKQLEKEAALWQIEGTSNSVADQMDHFLSSQSDYRGIATEYSLLFIVL